MTEHLPPVEVKLAGDGTGVLTGYASRFGGKPDAYGDVIEAGAFSTSLAQHAAAGARPPMLWAHDPSRPIGTWTDVREDATGLRVEGRLALDARDGADAYALLRGGAIDGLSIGFRTRDAERLPGGGRLLKAIDLIEVSVVALPAAQQARVISVKGKAMEDEVEVKDAPVEDAAETKTAERLGTLEATLAKLAGRLDKVEVKANRPGAAAVVEKRDAKAATFTKFIRSGREALDAVECKDLVVSDDTAGGFLAPAAFIGELLKNIVLFSPIRSLARVANISSTSAVLPRRTGRLTAQWVSEVQQRPETAPNYGQVRYVPNESACFVDISAQMLEDSAIDIASELSNDFAEEFGRLEGAAFVNGNGVGKPFGFMQHEAVPITPSGSATSLTSDSLIDLFHAVPSPYRANAAWLMNSKTMAMIRRLKTGDGQYLLALSGIQNAPATTLLGRPVVEVPDMPDVAAGSFPVVFGDFQKGYRIFDRTNLAVLRDPYSQATSGLVRFHARRRVAGGVAVAEALRKLQVVIA